MLSETNNQIDPESEQYEVDRESLLPEPAETKPKRTRRPRQAKQEKPVTAKQLASGYILLRPSGKYEFIEADRLDGALADVIKDPALQLVKFYTIKPKLKFDVLDDPSAMDV